MTRTHRLSFAIILAFITYYAWLYVRTHLSIGPSIQETYVPSKQTAIYLIAWLICFYNILFNLKLKTESIFGHAWLELRKPHFWGALFTGGMLGVFYGWLQDPVPYYTTHYWFLIANTQTPYQLLIILSLLMIGSVAHELLFRGFLWYQCTLKYRITTTWLLITFLSTIPIWAHRPDEVILLIITNGILGFLRQLSGSIRAPAMAMCMCMVTQFMWHLWEVHHTIDTEQWIHHVHSFFS